MSRKEKKIGSRLILKKKFAMFEKKIVANYYSIARSIFFFLLFDISIIYIIMFYIYIVIIIIYEVIIGLIFKILVT